MPVVNGRWVPSSGSADGSGYRGFNALVNEALENKYNDMYQNIPTNTTLRIRGDILIHVVIFIF